jgi:hypothetical protein
MPRILLQNFETGLYLDLVGAWTTSPELAQEFPNSAKATEFKITHRLNHVFAVLVPEPTCGDRAARMRQRGLSDAPAPAGRAEHCRRPTWQLRTGAGGANRRSRL